MRQISDPRAPFATIDDAINAGHEHARGLSGSVVGITAERQPGGYFCLLSYQEHRGRGGRAGRKDRQSRTIHVEIGKVGDGVFVPINETWLSGRPYYCALCGLGYAEFLACEEPDCALESAEVAQARLVKAHQEGKGMPDADG